VVREMDRRPRTQLMVVRQCRQGLKREFLRIDQVSVGQPVAIVARKGDPPISTLGYATAPS